MYQVSFKDGVFWIELEFPTKTMAIQAAQTSPRFAYITKRRRVPALVWKPVRYYDRNGNHLLEAPTGDPPGSPSTGSPGPCPARQ